MKAKDFLKQVMNYSSIAEDCNYIELDKMPTSSEQMRYIRATFGEEVCEILCADKPNLFGSFLYGYSGEHIPEVMPTAILVLYSDKPNENGKCIFLWKIED